MIVAFLQIALITLFFSFPLGVLVGLKIASNVLGIPKGYKVDKVTFIKKEFDE